jgi:hypothetical protein
VRRSRLREEGSDPGIGCACVACVKRGTMGCGKGVQLGGSRGEGSGSAHCRGKEGGSARSRGKAGDAKAPET